MIKCPNPDCGHQNVDGTQFCELCGEELPTPGATAAPSGAATATTADDMIVCPACENLNLPENVVCEVCGTELRPAGAGAPGAAAGVGSTGATGGVSAAAGAGDTMASPPDAPTSAPPGTDAAGGVALGAPMGSAPAGITPSGPGTTAPPASVGTPAMADLTAATASAPPATAIPGLSDTTVADDMTPVVAVGDTTSAVTTPDPMTITSPPGGPAPMPTSPPPPTVGAGVPAGDVPASGLSSTGVPAGVSGVTNAVTGAATGGLQPGGVKLTVEQGMTIGKQFVLGDLEMLVGREDTDEQIYPDIDLSDQDEGYVHRRHATLRFEDGRLTVTHLGGANKTRLNNRPLPDDTPEDVNLGDKLAFGKVVLRVQPN